MDNRKKILKIRGLVFVVVFIASVWFFNGQKNETPKPGARLNPRVVADKKIAEKSTKTVINEKREPAQQKTAESSTATGRELAALADMTKALYDYTRPGVPLSDLVDSLKNTKQNPVVTRNSNPYTGEMAIVRTKSPLPGTRYFHAQYFSDESKKTFVQHMSFEYRPGVGAMGDVVSEVGKAFAAAGKPVVSKPGYVRYSLEDGYILWIKKMEENDLKDDPYNAYTKKDVGTIRVAIEAEIHGDEDHKAHH